MEDNKWQKFTSEDIKKNILPPFETIKQHIAHQLKKLNYQKVNKFKPIKNIGSMKGIIMNSIDSFDEKIRKNPTLVSILNEKSGPQKRQELIKNIEKLTGNRLITYIALVNYPFGNEINPDDIQPIRDALTAVDKKENLDLMINSPGGLPDVVEKFVPLFRAERKQWRVIIPNYAKSAATLLALASDQIVMGNTSELGPIDPQMIRIGPIGQPQPPLPAHAFIDSYENLIKKVNERGSIEPTDILLFRNIDLTYIDYCEKAISRSQELANQWLKCYMLKNDPRQAEETATALSGKRRPHGTPIAWKEARDTLKLNIEYHQDGDELWENIWELYLRSEIYLRETQQVKLIERSTISLATRVMPLAPQR